MATFSHSKIQTFQQCRYKYKLQYIDRIKVTIPSTIELHLGSAVHAVLEKLYLDLRHGHLNCQDDLIKYYDSVWKKSYTPDILINDKRYTKEDYFLLGLRFILDYYKHYKPFNDRKTVDLETQDFLELSNGDKYHVRIDRLATDKDSNYYVCDYKTNNTLKSIDELSKDTQLAMYSIWVRRKFGDAKKIFLVWNFLAFDKEIILEKESSSLTSVQEDIERKISLINDCSEYPTSRSSLCEWCLYKDICPEFSDATVTKENKTEITLERVSTAQKNLMDFAKTAKKKDLDINIESLQNTIDSYANLIIQKKIIEEDIEELREKIISAHIESGSDRFHGAKNSVTVNESEILSFPSKSSKDKDELRRRLELEKFLKDNNLWEEFSEIDTGKLRDVLETRHISDRILTVIENFIEKKKQFRLKID